MRHLSLRLSLIATVSLVVLVGFGFCVRAAHLTYQALTALRSGDLTTASRSGSQALPIVKTLSHLTFEQVPDIEFWRLSLTLLSDAPTIKTEITQNLFNPTQSSSTHSARSVANQLLAICTLYEKTWINKRLTPNNQEQIANLIRDLRLLRDTLLTGQHSLIVVFQNTHELRATGGFTGSYALVQLDDGSITSLEIFDIYQPDGQFVGYVTAPTGVAEYLSSGRGLRLPDANWWPDFPASAQQMLAFFALGKTQTIDGVVAVNLTLIEDLLQITGPVYVPDYQVAVTNENVADVLRSNREEFFPGSVAKQHLLSSFVRLFRLKLSEATIDQQLAMGQVILNSFATKDIQTFSSQSNLQAWLEEKRLAGQQRSKLADQNRETGLYFFPVESNVGINKANRGITRAITATIEQAKTVLQISYHNNTSPNLAYVNYQRLFVLPTTQIEQITYQGQALPTWHEEIITTSTGEQFKQIGFLISLLPQQTGLVTIQMSHPPLLNQTAVVWQKQSGVEPYPLTIEQGQTRQLHQLDRDWWFTWPLQP